MLNQIPEKVSAIICLQWSLRFVPHFMIYERFSKPLLHLILSFLEKSAWEIKLFPFSRSGVEAQGTWVTLPVSHEENVLIQEAGLQPRSPAFSITVFLCKTRLCHIIIIIVEHSLYARYCSKDFTKISSFNTHNKPLQDMSRNASGKMPDCLLSNVFWHTLVDFSEPDIASVRAFSSVISESAPLRWGS